MPLAMVRRKAIVSDKNLKDVLDILPSVVAKALSFGPAGSDTQLTEKEIEVWVSDAHRFDRGTYDLEIMVFAHDYPVRRANLEDRRRVITKEIMMTLANSPKGNYIEGWVWVYLGHSDFCRLWCRSD